MPFSFGARSRYNLLGVHPDLVALARNTVGISAIDFRITEGRRTEARQRLLVASGASRTMKSRHLTGHAVDVAALVNGRVRWEIPLYVQIAEAFRDAAGQMGIPVEWGGCWRSIIGCGDIDRLLADYADRCRAEGRRPFIDAAHFQLPWKNYP